MSADICNFAAGTYLPTLILGSLLSNASYGLCSKGSWGPSPDQLEADTDTDDTDVF